jgi:hypothetical protein
MRGLWTVTYTNNKDSYQEIFFTDSLVVLLGEDQEQRYRQVEITDNDSIMFSDYGEVYLTGKIVVISDEKVEIISKDFKAELNKIHNLLLDDNVMTDIIKGTERNVDKEELWRERFNSRMIDWEFKRGLIEK